MYTLKIASSLYFAKKNVHWYLVIVFVSAAYCIRCPLFRIYNNCMRTRLCERVRMYLCMFFDGAFVLSHRNSFDFVLVRLIRIVCLKRKCLHKSTSITEMCICRAFRCDSRLVCWDLFAIPFMRSHLNMSYRIDDTIEMLVVRAHCRCVLSL